MNTKVKNKNKKPSRSPAEDDDFDERFAEIKNDPRYLEMPQKAKKVTIDKKRFGKLFDKNSEFNTIGKFDKTGKRIDQKDKMMQKYYRMDEDGDGEEDGEEQVAAKKSKKDKRADSESEEDSSARDDAEKQPNRFYDKEGNF